MKIVILAGGTGSIALQTGLYHLLDKRIDGVDTKVIVNAYDNGLSTGAVRKVCGGRILGPSDVRKNQTTRLKLEQPDSPWNKFLDIRFTVESDRAQAFCLARAEELEKELQDYEAWQLTREAIDTYFNIPVASRIDYNDFSLANIVYAGFARANGNSLRKAAFIMSKLMRIQDNVLLNDDRSLFLGAVTKSGKRFTDEADIVSWGSLDDPFVDVFFTDADGHESRPMLCSEAANALYAADLIILSSGTQWSSLIPTYASIGFETVMSECEGKIVMVMNRQPDKDSPGQSASDIIKLIVPKYVPDNKINLIMDETSPEMMRTIDHVAGKLLRSYSRWNLAEAPVEVDGKKTKHHSIKLAKAVGEMYFGPRFLKCDHIMFDYDDTLVGRGNKFPRSSAFNKAAILNLRHHRDVSICTGNTIKAIDLRSKGADIDWTTGDPLSGPPLTVFADGGVNKYLYDTTSIDGSDDGVSVLLEKCIDPGALFTDSGSIGIKKLISLFTDMGIPLAKIENRGNVMLAIRPIDEEYRPAILNLIKLLLDGSGLVVKPTGRSTIEIMKHGVSKVAAIMSVVNSPEHPIITYVGDELKSGNDEPIASLKCANINCLLVKDPSETAFFLMTLEPSYGY